MLKKLNSSLKTCGIWLQDFHKTGGNQDSTLGGDKQNLVQTRTQGVRVVIPQETEQTEMNNALEGINSKHPLPTAQEKTLHMDITRRSTPKSDWLYSLQPKMEKLYTVSKNKTGGWLYRASPSLAAKNIINLISVLAIWWCPRVESSLVLLEEDVCYD